MRFITCCLAFLFAGISSFSQDSTGQATGFISAKYPEAVATKAKSLEQQLNKKSQKAIQRFKKQELVLAKKLKKADSLQAKILLDNITAKYKDLEQRMANPGKLTQYIPFLDTLKTSLKFLEDKQALMQNVKEGQSKITDAFSKLQGLESQLQKAETIKQFLKERRQFLKEQFAKIGFAKQLKKINKQAYYYGQQVNEYKSILKDPKKAERKAIELLSKTELFKTFMRKNSQLASLFRLPGDPADPSSQSSFAGLQTRAQVNQILQQRIGSGGPNAQQQIQQNIQDAQSQLAQLKNKINSLGGGSSDAEMPDFKPNNQKTKSFLKRLEYGTNMQSQKASAFFPVTSDIGLSLGYKLNDKSSIGIGAAYKIGWGTGWKDINITHQGIGLRSFIDWKIKGSFYIAGGYEQNYRTEIKSIDQLKDYSGWQSSGLIGVSKKYKVSKKFKGNMQLLWDFLSYQQMPRAQAVVFRVGYSLK